MSVKDKFAQTANKMRLVYDAGVFDAGFAQGTEYGMSLVENQSVPFKEIDSWWDSRKGYYEDKTDFTAEFTYIPDEMFRPKAPLVPVGAGAKSMFNGSHVVFIDETKVDFSQATELAGTFGNCGSLKKVSMNVAKVRSLNVTFSGSEELEEVVLANLSNECTFRQVFRGCDNLTTLVIYGTIGQNGFDVSGCPNLSVVSLSGILDCLEDKNVSGGEVWTCKIGEANLAKLTEKAPEAIEAAEAKNWVIE